MPAKRIAYIEILPRAIAHFFKPGDVFQVVSGLPEDAVFVSAWLGDFGRLFQCLFESESFDPVPDGTQPPKKGPVEIKTYAAGLTLEDADYLKELADMIDSAERTVAHFPGEVIKTDSSHTIPDKPEGRITIQLSDTLAREISGRLRGILGEK